MFLDTSGLLCFLNAAEPHHEEFAELLVSTSHALTTDHVLAELIALVTARRGPRHAALDFVADLLTSERVEVVYVDDTLFRRALDLLARRPDKDWSLCDAASFVVMNEHRETEALTLDHHFEQAGFVRVPAV
jgi:uncharacterized protein